MRSVRQIDFSPEWHFRTSRSSGKGGQHVNKVESRVELEFDVAKSALLTQDEKERIMQKLSGRINHDGILLLSAEADRSQFRNKETAIQKFYDLIDFALRIPKERKATRPSRASKEKRLQSKKHLSEKKSSRSGKW